MKKIIVVAAVLALAGTQVQTARAGDCEWSTAGNILTGMAVGAVIASAVNSHADVSVSYRVPGYVYCPPPAPVVCAPRVICAPPVVYAPQPVVVYRPAVVCAPVVCAPPVLAVRYGHGHHDRW